MDLPRRFAYEPFEDLSRLFNLASNTNAPGTIGFPNYYGALTPGSLANALIGATSPSALSTTATTGGRAAFARMDIADKKDHYEVQVELPGVRKEDISVHIDGNRLYVQASKEEARQEERGRVFLNERHFGSIRRSVEMPSTVDSEKVKANIEHGVLNIWIGKKADTEPGRQVPIE